MRKFSVYIFCAISFLLNSCEKGAFNFSDSFLGEWRYVGTFDHRADYECYICPSFDFEKSIYRLTLNGDNSLSTQINYMRGEGKYELSLSDPKDSRHTFNISIKDYKELNKPIETFADSVFRNAFLASYWISTGEQLKEYDQLQLQFNENQFLLFVRKN